MNEQIKRNTPALVEQTLANYGAWDAVSFLLISHHLRQTSYEAWRMGEVTCLEDVLTGNPQHILDMLDTALRHATSMHLISTPTTWSGWGNKAEQTLRLFHDDSINARFQQRLSPSADRPQLDLFMDAPQVILLNSLRQALLKRSPECDALFDRAMDEIPHEAALVRLDIIRAAMGTSAIDRPVAWLTYLNEVIAPTARDEFSHRSMDIMAPLWRTAAHAMQPIPFDPDRPDNHASYAFLLAHDWEQCLASLEQIPDCFEQAGLYDRRIATLAAMREHQAERAAWIMYCWFCPDAATTALEQADLHACGLHGLWQDFSQLENEQNIGDFPALIALMNLSPDDQTIIFEHAGHTTGFQHYQQVLALLASEQQGDTDIERRSALKESSPWLFQVFMASRL
ncbi:MAG: hypothetical protein Q9M16_07320 [Mariprofundus sp.]|nr:hypothetical protein [Mariprofundus sp.]